MDTTPTFRDCHAAVGRWTIRPPAGALEADELREVLRSAGVAGGLVHHGLGRDYDPAAGNDALLAELAAPPPGGAQSVAPAVELVPCATLLPSETEELPPPEEHLPALIRQGVRGARLYPRSHNFSLEEWCAGRLLTALERHRLPVTMDLAETSWSAVHDLCDAHPALPVVVTRVSYRNERFLYPLLRQHPRLHVEVSLFQGHRALEEVVDRFGPQRLLFGTGLPFFDVGGPILSVLRADVGPHARRAIAGDNLQALMAEVREVGQ